MLNNTLTGYGSMSNLISPLLHRVTHLIAQSVNKMKKNFIRCVIMVVFQPGARRALQVLSDHNGCGSDPNQTRPEDSVFQTLYIPLSFHGESKDYRGGDEYIGGSSPEHRDRVSVGNVRGLMELVDNGGDGTAAQGRKGRRFAQACGGLQDLFEDDTGDSLEMWSQGGVDLSDGGHRRERWSDESKKNSRSTSMESMGSSAIWGLDGGSRWSSGVCQSSIVSGDGRSSLESTTGVTRAAEGEVITKKRASFKKEMTPTVYYRCFGQWRVNLKIWV